MRKVTLIQFTSPTHEDHGYTPTPNQWYKVHDMNADYYYEEDDEEYTLEAIRVWYVNQAPFLPSRELIVPTDSTTYNTIEIELDDNSPLFI